MTGNQDKFDWDRVFGGIASGTFAVQLISILILFGASLVFVLMLTGVWGIIVATQDLFILVVLLGSGFAFLLFIWLLGLFLRFHRRVRRFILGKGVGDVDANDPASKTILTLFAVAVLFVLSVTVQVTTVSPIGKVAGALLVTDFTPSLSEVAGLLRVTVAKSSPASVFAVTSAAQVMVGSSLSLTVTF